MSLASRTLFSPGPRSRTKTTFNKCINKLDKALVQDTMTIITQKQHCPVPTIAAHLLKEGASRHAERLHASHQAFTRKTELRNSETLYNTETGIRRRVCDRPDKPTLESTRSDYLQSWTATITTYTRCSSYSYMRWLNHE